MIKTIAQQLLPLACLILAHIAMAADGYDPLALADSEKITLLEATVDDLQRNRRIPVLVYLPAFATPAPVILFSHGLGGSRDGNSYLGKHWAARGYAVVYLQHAGSDESVWRDAPPGERMRAMREAANLENFMLRVQDVPFVLDQLDAWNREVGHPLHGRMDLGRVGMSGHSFGAVTTQAVSGQYFPRRGTGFTDPRVRAAVAFSPSSPRLGDPAQAFGKVNIPWLLMTGTRDDSPIGGADVESRLKVFPALPPGGKYEAVLDNAEHSAFGDRPLPGDREARNPNHHRAILALSTAFWDAWLRGDPAARAWLDGSGPASVLEAKDQWRRK